MNVVHDMVPDIDLTTPEIGRLEPEPRALEMDAAEVDEGFQEEEDDPTQPPVDTALLRPQPEDCPLRRPPPPTTPVRPLPPEEPTSPPRTPVRPSTITAEESPISVSIFIHLFVAVLTCVHFMHSHMLMDMFLNIFSIFQPTSDRHGIPGFTQVEFLADYLYSLRNQDLALTHDQASHIVRLWDLLTDFDKQPTVPSPRHSLRLTKPSTSTYKSRNKQSVVPGVDTVNRLVAIYCMV